MQKRIGFVAIGQAGGNIGQLFEKKGYSVLYLNTSQEDLDTLQDAKFKYHISNGEGCNKDRNKAKQLIIDDYDNIAQEIETKIGTQMIFVIFASGGGTGSGAAPMLIDLLVDDGKTVGAITIIPALTESLKSQMNSYEAFKELTNIDGTGACFIIDNNTGDKLELNERLVEPFHEFVMIPANHKSTKGIIDKAEIMETLKAHGMAYVFATEPNSAAVMKAIKDNTYSSLECDQVIKYIAVSLAGDVNLEDIQKEVGIPLDSFVTYNDNATVCCISGLSYPQTRMDSVYNVVDNSKDVVMKNLRSTRENQMRDDINFLSLGEEKNAKQEIHKPKTKRDIMSKYLKQ